jgi:hypothetical protein
MAISAPAKTSAAIYLATRKKAASIGEAIAISSRVI